MTRQPNYRYELAIVHKQLQTTLQQVADLLERTPLVQLDCPERPMSKAEFADFLHVTPRTLSNWLKPFQHELDSMGIPKKKKTLSIEAVRFLSEKLTF